MQKKWVNHILLKTMSDLASPLRAEADLTLLLRRKVSSDRCDQSIHNMLSLIIG